MISEEKLQELELFVLKRKSKGGCCKEEAENHKICVRQEKK